MMIPRIIPLLLMKNRGLYKGINFRNHKYVGDPINTVKIFNDKEVDEIIILDIESTLKNKNIDFEYLREVVSEAFIPLAYGGGIKYVEEARKLFAIGIEKIVLNTYAVLNPNLVRDLVKEFGSQAIVFSLDVKKTFWGYKVFIKCGTVETKYDPIDFAMYMEELGVGEILLNDIDRDGTMGGYNLELINQISKKIKIPLIACGGAGKLEDFKKAVEAGASACAAGSMFVFQGPHRAVLISYPNYEDLKNIFGQNI